MAYVARASLAVEVARAAHPVKQRYRCSQTVSSILPLRLHQGRTTPRFGLRDFETVRSGLHS